MCMCVCKLASISCMYIFLDRPENLLTNFIAWRGMLTKMLCSPYNHQEPWRLAATLYNGTIYLQEIETEEKRRQEAAMPPQQKAACYWGLKFEDYVTCKGSITPVRTTAYCIYISEEDLQGNTFLGFTCCTVYMDICIYT